MDALGSINNVKNMKMKKNIGGGSCGIILVIAKWAPSPRWLGKIKTTRFRDYPLT